MSGLASNLTERVTFQQQSASDDGYGGQATAWADVLSVFAQVQPIYSNVGEDEVAGQPNARAGYRVIIRARSDINAGMRIVWKSHTLRIHSLHEVADTLSILTDEENL
ncbi:MAG: phage head closure protein [Rickettsiales bacterium]